MSTEFARVRVMLVDDQSDIRKVLQLMLERTGQFEVVGQAGDGEEAVRAASELLPDVIVMDVMMPKKNGVEACREIMEALPDTRVVMLTASTEEDAVIQALAAGATAYLPKMSDLDQLVSTLKAAAAGEMQMPTAVVRRVFSKIQGTARPEMQQADLTLNEKEILASFSRGASYYAIGEARRVEPVTIRNAICDIQAKLGVDTKQEMVVWAVRNGLSYD